MSDPTLRSLQKIEESVYRPKSIDDSVLLGIADNAERATVAEVTPKHLGGTLNALASQIRQLTWGTVIGKEWSNVPPITLQDISGLSYSTGSTSWLAGENIEPGNIVYVSTAGEVRLADRRFSTNISIIGVSKDAGTAGSTVRIVHSGNILDGFTGLIPGVRYYLNINGGLTAFPASNTGEIVVMIGIAKTTTSLFVMLSEPKIRA